MAFLRFPIHMQCSSLGVTTSCSPGYTDISFASALPCYVPTAAPRSSHHSHMLRLTYACPVLLRSGPGAAWEQAGVGSVQARDQVHGTLSASSICSCETLIGAQEAARQASEKRGPKLPSEIEMWQSETRNIIKVIAISEYWATTQPGPSCRQSAPKNVMRKVQFPVPDQKLVAVHRTWTTAAMFGI